jgi:predicted TIM-barrel enzyme
MNFSDKPILGMIHLSGYGNEVVKRALEEINIYIEEGLHGCIVENYHGTIFDVINVLKALEGRFIPDNFHIGVNILPNDYDTALIIAELTSASFIQLDYVAGDYGKTQKIDRFRYQQSRGAFPNVKVLGGVWPKYYTPVAGSVLKDDLETAKLRCDAIVVTGEGTGVFTPIEKIKSFREIIGDFPLIVGAGVNKDNVTEQLRIADGAIVGSCFKTGSMTNQMVSRSLVRDFMSEYKKI